MLLHWHINSCQAIFTCERRFSFSSSSSSLSGSASSIFACSSFCAWAELGRSGFLGTCLNCNTLHQKLKDYCLYKEILILILTNLRIYTHLIANSFPVIQYLLLQQLKEPRRKELKVLNVRLFGWTRSLWGSGETLHYNRLIQIPITENTVRHDVSHNTFGAFGSLTRSASLKQASTA